THTGEASTAAAATASEQEVLHEEDVIQTSLQPSNEPVADLRECTGNAQATAGPSLQARRVALTTKALKAGMPPAMKDTPEKAFLHHQVKHYAAIHVSTKKKIKRLQQAQHRLQRKVAHLSSVIDDLSKNKILIEENIAALQSLAGSKENLLMRHILFKNQANHIRWRTLLS
ncbi:hypothetical protein V5799_014461, partial [Amblyomma americanum]